MNIQIQTTSMCNASCVFCPHRQSWFKKNPGTMDDETFLTILNKIKTLPNINKLCLYLMNEPLLDDKLIDGIKLTKQTLSNYGLLEISTNALLLDTKTINDLYDVFHNVPHEIWISFHGIDKETYEYNMKIPFERTLSNIKQLIESKNGLNCKIHGIGGSHNDCISKVFSREEYYGFWHNQYNPNEYPGLRLDYFFHNNRGGNVQKKNDKFNNTRQNCVRLYDWLHIDYTGDALICCNDYNKETRIGNIVSQSMQDVLDSPILKQYRKWQNGSEQAPDGFICSRCDMQGVGNVLL